jgi:hypothetical protein
MDQGELDHALDELDARLVELHALYTGFFAGSGVEEPLSFRQEIDRALAALMSRCTLDSASRAKIQGVLRTYDEYQQAWERLARRTMSGQQRLRPSSTLGPSSSPPPSSDRAAAGLLTNASVRPPKRASGTPPLGSPLVAPAAKVSASGLERRRAMPAGSSDTAKTTTDLRSPVERHGRTNPEPRRPVPLKLAMTLQGIRIPQENELTPVYSARERWLALTTEFSEFQGAAEAVQSEAQHVDPPPQSENPRADPPVSQTLLARSGARVLGRERVSLETVREIHEQLRALSPATTRPVSLERLAQALRETEEKLWAEHGDRRVTFEVIVKDGRAVVKPIVH